MAQSFRSCIQWSRSEVPGSESRDAPQWKNFADARDHPEIRTQSSERKLHKTIITRHGGESDVSASACLDTLAVRSTHSQTQSLYHGSAVVSLTTASLVTVVDPTITMRTAFAG